ncbi:putative sarcosine oxidase [Thozetella sp. PMI_491]|nr:putative sarcosine oxidase [Thozetella sp. PMI_491]
MAAKTPSKTGPIIIVGAGAFGLSTALHLGRRGYTDVTVFDRQPYDETLYSYFKGCDAASADINKIIRAGYGSGSVYQDITLEAVAGWSQWNDELKSGQTVPPGMSTADRVWANNGNISMTDGDVVPEFEAASIRSLPKGTQLVSIDEKDQQTAKVKGFNIEPFKRQRPDRPNVAVLDITGGTAFADKACRFALHKARSYGVKFVLDRVAGDLKELLRAPGSQDVLGIKTADGKTHTAQLTILACGGWTPSILPALDGLNETTAGSVALLKIPRDSPFWDRLAPENFPSWLHKMRDGADGGLYGFARDENGWFKIGYRGTKYTNPKLQPDGKERSVPVTRWSEGERITAVPAKALQVIQKFLDDYLPELGEAGIHISMTRICWYNDSFDNHLTVDRVPGANGLMVATSGSGHAFKYLPSLGNWVTDVIEGVGVDRPAIKAWRWRDLGNDTPFNVIMEGSKGPRAFGNIPMVSDSRLGASAKL